MTCNQVREQLDLAFGVEELSSEIQAHLQTCLDCRAYYDELHGLEVEFGPEADILFSEFEVGRAAALVDQAIAEPTNSTIISVNWMRRLTRVAAAVLIVASSWTAYRIGMDNGTEVSQPADTNVTYDYVTGSEYLDESAYIDENAVSLLVEDYASPLAAENSLIGEITEEEMQYLMDNFDVGEIL